MKSSKLVIAATATALLSGIAIAVEPSPPEVRLRTIAQAVQLYAAENRGRLPPTLGYTLGDRGRSEGLIELLVPTTRPADFAKWTPERRGIWVDDHTDVRYLLAWQHADARDQGRDGRLGFGTPRSISRERGPLLLLPGDERSLLVAFADGHVERFVPESASATSQPTTRSSR